MYSVLNVPGRGPERYLTFPGCGSLDTPGYVWITLQELLHWPKFNDMIFDIYTFGLRGVLKTPVNLYHVLDEIEIIYTQYV